MPRPANSCLLNLFRLNELNQIICNNDSCNGKVLFKHTTNLQRHLKVLHPKLYSLYLEAKKTKENKNELHLQKKLIELVRDRPILWNSTTLGASASAVQSWVDISQELDMEVDACREKWEHLRKRFTKTLLKKHRSGSGTHYRSPSHYKLFACLQFLRNEELSDENISEHNEPEEIEYINSDVIDDSNNSFALNIKDEDATTLQNNINVYEKESNQKSSEAESEVDNDDWMDEKEKLINTKFKLQLLEEENDAERMFLLSLQSYLNKIPVNRRLMVRQKIQGILLEEQQNQEQSHPSIKIEVV